MRDYVWLVIHWRSGWGLLWLQLCLLIACLDKDPLSSSDSPPSSREQRHRQAPNGSEAELIPLDSHTGRTGPAYTALQKGLASRLVSVGSGKALTRGTITASSFDTWVVLWLLQGHIANTSTAHLTAFSINDQGQGHSHALKRDVQIHALLPLRHWVSVWRHVDTRLQTRAVCPSPPLLNLHPSFTLLSSTPAHLSLSARGPHRLVVRVVGRPRALALIGVEIHGVDFFPGSLL